MACLKKKGTGLKNKINVMATFGDTCGVCSAGVQGVLAKTLGPIKSQGESERVNRGSSSRRDK